MKYTGNNTDFSKTAKATQSPQHLTLFEGATRPSVYIERESATADGCSAYFTIAPDGILMSDLPLEQKVALSFIIKQAYYQGSPNNVKVSNSVMMNVISLKQRRNLYPHIESLIAAGYISKSIITYKEGLITAYTLNIGKIEKDFGISLKDIYKNWKNN